MIVSPPSQTQKTAMPLKIFVLSALFMLSIGTQRAIAAKHAGEIGIGGNKSASGIVLQLNREIKVKALINVGKHTISFQKLVYGKWQKWGEGAITTPNARIVRCEDLNGDGVKEILVCGRNNANQTVDAYIHSSAAARVEYAGSFTSDYEINLKDKSLEVVNVCAWHMQFSKERYVWQGLRLVLTEKLAMQVARKDLKCDSTLVTYYKADSSQSGNMNVIWSDVFVERTSRNDAYELIWDNFFTTTCLRYVACDDVSDVAPAAKTEHSVIFGPPSSLLRQSRSDDPR